MRVIVAGELPREEQNAPLHLFSASPELVGFGQGAYQQHSERTSRVLGQLFERFKKEGFTVAYTMANFMRDVVKEHFPELTPEEQQEVLRSLPAERQEELLRALPAERQEELLRALPPEKLLAAVSPEQIRQYLDRLSGERPAKPHKPRRKK